MSHPKINKKVEGPVKQTVGHDNNQQLSTSSQAPGTSKENICAFIESWQQMDRAGSCLSSSICKDLSGTQLDSLKDVLDSGLFSVFSGSMSEQVLGCLKEIENLLASLQGQVTDKGVNKGKSQSQVFSRILLLFVKLQADYHQKCTQSLSSLVEQLMHSCDNNDNNDLLQEMKNLELHRYVSSRQSPSRSFGLKKTSASGSYSPKTSKHSIKASLFSLFERKNSPDESNSSFYVDLDQRASNEIIQSQLASVPDKTGSSQSETLIQLGLDPAVSNEESANYLGAEVYKTTDNAFILTPSPAVCDGVQLRPKYQGLSPGSPANFMLESGAKPVISIGATGVTTSTNGAVASQEELDSVINLLSGVGTSPSGSHMSPIPEQQSHLSLQVPSLYGSLSPAASDSCMDSLNTQRIQSQRRSEGSLDLSGFGNPGRNTWPHQHRSSLPAGYLVSQVQYDYSNAAHPRTYLPDSRPAMTLPPGGPSHFPPGYQWGFPDPKLNRTWPVNNLAGSSTWSAGQDSDDLSDDDSSGDQFCNITQKQPQMFIDDTAAAMKKASQETEGRHHSFDDLLDGQATSSWQATMQPWSQPMKKKEPVMSHDQSYDMARNSGYHKPLTMQWSDPLSSRNMWPSSGVETQEHIQSQSIQGFGGQI